MSVKGQQRLIDDVHVMSACPSTSDISLRRGKRRSGPIADIEVAVQRHPFPALGRVARSIDRGRFLHCDAVLLSVITAAGMADLMIDICGPAPSDYCL